MKLCTALEPKGLSADEAVEGLSQSSATFTGSNPWQGEATIVMSCGRPEEAWGGPGDARAMAQSESLVCF